MKTVNPKEIGELCLNVGNFVGLGEATVEVNTFLGCLAAVVATFTINMKTFRKVQLF